METPQHTQFIHINPYEKLSIIQFKTQTQLDEFKLEVSNKNKQIKLLEIEKVSATKYIERMEQKYVDSADECVTIKAENVSLNERLKLYEDKFGKLE